MGIDMSRIRGLMTADEVEAERRKPCEQCGERIVSTTAHRFCSTTCRNRALNSSRKVARSVCKLCGKPAPSARQKACSAKCAYTLRKMKTRPARPCDQCGHAYFPSGMVRKRFCSERCRVAALRASAFETKACSRCGVEFTRRKVRTRPTKFSFCSRECAKGFRTGELSSAWRGGSDPNRGAKWNALAEKIRERDGYECRRCGKTQAEAGERLSVDHVHPWRSFENKSDANQPENLVALCRSCHTVKTTTVEAAWLRGDRLPMQAFKRAVGLLPAVLS